MGCEKRPKRQGGMQPPRGAEETGFYLRSDGNPLEGFKQGSIGISKRSLRLLCGEWKERAREEAGPVHEKAPTVA